MGSSISGKNVNQAFRSEMSAIQANYKTMTEAADSIFTNPEVEDIAIQAKAITQGNENNCGITRGNTIGINDLTAKYSEAIAPSDKPIAETLDDVLSKKQAPEAAGLIDDTSLKNETENTNTSSNLGK